MLWEGGKKIFAASTRGKCTEIQNLPRALFLQYQITSQDKNIHFDLYVFGGPVPARACVYDHVYASDCAQLEKIYILYKVSL